MARLVLAALCGYDLQLDHMHVAPVVFGHASAAQQSAMCYGEFGWSKEMA